MRKLTPEAARAMGQATSVAKLKASWANGRLGGRPRRVVRLTDGRVLRVELRGPLYAVFLLNGQGSELLCVRQTAHEAAAAVPSLPPPALSAAPAPTGRQAAAPATAAVRPRPKDVVMTQVEDRAALDARVLQFLRAHGPSKASALLSVFDLSPYHLKTSLTRLQQKKRVRLTGKTSQARWSLVPGAPGTTTTTPDGHAGGGPSGKADRVEFETVWSGKKTDPSLLGDRTQRTS